jgi:predicted RNase H-like HicB family nuclease
MTPNKKIERQSLEYYLSLKYPISIYLEEEGYTVMIPDLPGCITQGETLEECIVNIEEARELWIETVYANGKKDIPLPSKRIAIACENCIKKWKTELKELINN